MPLVIQPAELDRRIANSMPTWLGSQRNPTPEQIKQALENGRCQEARAAKRYSKWAKKNPEQAERNAKAIAIAWAGTLDEYIIDARAALEAVLPEVITDIWQQAINLVVLSGPPGAEALRDNLIARMKNRIAALSRALPERTEKKDE